MSGLGRVERKRIATRESRRLMIRTGSSPFGCADTRPANPARGKAQGRIDLPAAAGGCGSQMGVKAQKSNATNKNVPGRSPFPSAFHSGARSPRRKSIGADGWRAKATRGPEHQKWTAHPSAGANLRRAGRKTQERRRKTRNRKEETLNLALPARPR